MTPLPPRLEVVDPDAGRLVPEAAETPEIARDVPPAGVPTARLLLGGAAVLAIGLPAVAAVGLIADQFGRAAWLGWGTLAVCALGFGLLVAAILGELRALRALGRVDRLRADLASADAAQRMDAAKAWAGRVGVSAALREALARVNDPDAALALLRAGPGEDLRRQADGLGRRAAVQVVAGIAAVPSPALDALFVGWRAVRLVRQVATLYGIRPGALATLSLLRRSAMAATLVGGTEVAANAAASALLSNPLIGRLAGELAGAGVAARRMVVLARAAAVACDPLPPG